MDIKLLDEFLTLSKTLNYTKASELLLISRPTLSKHIKSIEEELGVELFTRSTKKVELTQQGRIFREHAHAIMGEYNNALIKLKGNDAIEGVLHVGGCLRYPIVSRAITSEVALFQKKYREVDIRMIDIYYQDFRNMLVKGTYDIVCSFRLPNLDEEGLEFIPLFEMDVCAWVSHDSPLATKTSISFEELANYVIRYMDPNNSQQLTSFYRTIFEKRGLQPRIGKPITSTFFMDDNEFCLFPLVRDSKVVMPNVVQIPIENTEHLPVCWIKKRKTVNPLAELFFENLRERLDK